jgi:hypothetical protein
MSSVILALVVTVSSLLLGPIFLYFLSLFYLGLAANCMFCVVRFTFFYFPRSFTGLGQPNELRLGCNSNLFFSFFRAVLPFAPTRVFVTDGNLHAGDF